jgi:RNA polymerase sigma-70 factor (ECF subfamily)
MTTFNKQWHSTFFNSCGNYPLSCRQDFQMDAHDFASLVDKLGPALILYARQWCQAPEDVVQDAFVKLVAQREPPREVIPWLYRVVRNGALDAGKSARRRVRREQATAKPERWFVEQAIDGLDAESCNGSAGLAH